MTNCKVNSCKNIIRMSIRRFGNEKLMSPAENLGERKCWDDQRGQMFSSRITMTINASVKYATWSNRSILFLNGTSALFIRRAIESKIHRCTLLNLSPRSAYSPSLLSFSLRHPPRANSQIAAKVASGSAVLWLCTIRYRLCQA